MEEEFWKQEGHKSIEEYLKKKVEERVPPLFNSEKSFRELLEKGFLKKRMIIRTSRGGAIDEHYRINEDGTLTGMPSPIYEGLEGTFSPEKILRGKRISSFWSIESPLKLSYLLKQKGLL